MSVSNTYQVKVDIKKKPTTKAPEVIANDKVVFEVEVFDNGTLFPLDEGYIYYLVSKSYKKDANAVIRQGTLTGGKIVFALGSSEFEHIGKVEATVQIFDATNKRVSTAYFDYKVVKDNSFEGELPNDEKNLVIVNESVLNGISEQLADKATKQELNSTNTIVNLKADKLYVDSVTQSLATGSPKGVYANLTSLQSAFPNGNNNIYVVSADGKWYYWSGSAWTAGGTYQATSVADGAITPNKLSNEAISHNVLLYMGGNYATGDSFLPSVDTVNQTLTFLSKYSDGGFVINGTFHLLFQPNEAFVVDLKKTITSTLGKIVFRISDKSISILDYNTVTPNNDYVTIGTIRYHGSSLIGSVDFVFPYLLDGLPVGITKENTAKNMASFILPMNGALPNFNTSANTLTFFNDTILIYEDKHYILPETVVNLGSILSSAKKVYFNTTTETFHLLAFSDAISYIGKDFILVASVRRTTTMTIASMTCPYTVDGKLFGRVKDSIVQNPLDAFVKSINHRGYNTAPENTLSAYKLSKSMGYSYVEADIQFSNDGIPILIHDLTVDRTSNGTGNVADKTLAQLKELDFGSWKDAKYVGEKIPTFEEFIILCKSLNLHPYIELKSGFTTLDRIESVVNIVKKLGMINNVSWITTIPMLENIKTLAPTTRLGYLTFGEVNQTHIDQIKTLKSNTNKIFINCQREFVTRSLVEYANINDVPFECWDVHSNSQVIDLVQMGVTGISNDNLNVAEILGN